MIPTTLRNPRHLGAALTFVLATWTWASSAHAQEPMPAPPAVEGYPSPPEAQPAPPPAEVPPPAPTPAPPPPVTHRTPEPDAEVQGANDLDPATRPVGIGYAGLSQVPVGPNQTLTAPAIGVRIWTSPKVGVDIALGFGWADGSTKSGTVTVERDAIYGFILQAGVPLALATHRHVSFQLVPNMEFAYGATKVPGGATPTVSVSGKRFGVGARAGFEIFWGFIGLPQLSLSATVGVAFEMLSTKSDSGIFGVTTSATTYGITTTVQNNPWDIFTGNVAARYYF